MDEKPSMEECSVHEPATNDRGFGLAFLGWTALLSLGLFVILFSHFEHDAKRILGLATSGLMALAAFVHLIIRILRCKRTERLGYLAGMLVAWFLMYSVFAAVWRAQCCAYAIIESTSLRGIVTQMVCQEQEGIQPFLARDGKFLIRGLLSHQCCRFDLADFTYAGMPLREVLDGDWTEEQLFAMRAAEQERWGSGSGFDFVGPFVVRTDAPMGGPNAGFEGEEPVGMLIFGGPASHTESITTHHIVFGDYHVEWLFSDEAGQRLLGRMDVMRRMGLPEDVAERWFAQFAAE
ncbi:MAG: hypothetical protein AAGB34_04605 [Planctomycetota bacterium]